MDLDSESGSRIRILDPDPGFDYLKLKKKITSGNLIFIFLIKNCNFLFSRPPLRTPNLQENPSALKRENIQHFKT